MSNPVNKADALKSLRNSILVRTMEEGDEPENIPLRKRAYYRALEQNKNWALLQRDLIQYVNEAFSYSVRNYIKKDKLIDLAKQRILRERWK